MNSQAKISFINSNRAWILAEFDKLRAEWVVWSNEVDKIVDQPYDKNTQLEVYADGVENINKHDLLQTKTLAFLDQNIHGHGFINGFDGDQCDRTDLRLKFRVAHRLHQLEKIRAALEYANSPSIKSSVSPVQADPNLGTSSAWKFVVGIISGVIVAGIVYWLDWN